MPMTMEESKPTSRTLCKSTVVRVQVQAGLTVTVVDCWVVPPAPVQEMIYVVVEVGETPCEPPVAVLDVHPAGETAAHEVASVDVHVNVDELPLMIVDGAAERFTVGGGGGRAPPDSRFSMRQIVMLVLSR
ncbi:MAG: hypothetical protein HZA28_03060 [Candidatus Omnitrophica bacterium]|nr:hypothetical protein [Candidatus Omnitrophota bacterium]